MERQAAEKRRARGLPLIDQQGPAAPLTPYWKQVYARDPEAPALVLPDYRTALDAARAGAGLAVAPECLCRDALRAGQLVAAPQARRPPSFALYAARQGTAVRARALPGTIDRGGRALVARPRRSAQLRHVVLLHRPAAPAQLVLDAQAQRVGGARLAMHDEGFPGARSNPRSQRRISSASACADSIGRLSISARTGT